MSTSSGRPDITLADAMESIRKFTAAVNSTSAAMLRLSAVPPVVLPVPPVVFPSYMPSMGLLIPMDHALLLRMVSCSYEAPPCPRKRQARRRKIRIRARIVRRGWN